MQEVYTGMKLEWLIATRYLKSKRKESFVAFISWFSLIGIMLGVAVLIIVMSVMNGFRKEMVRNIIGADGHVFVYANTEQFPEYNKTIARIKKILMLLWRLLLLKPKC